MNKIILIVGPTGVGKTNISIKIAKYLNAEIINADSRYIYKEPQIATAKVTKEEMDNIKHHMVDACSLNDEYNIYKFQKDGRKILNRLISENKNIVIVGGSGLYVKALLYNYELEKDKNIIKDYSKYTNEELKKIIDNIYGKNDIHVNNRQRLERYLLHYESSGKIITKTNNINEKLYNFISIGLKTDKQLLYDRINQRVDEMFEDGLLNEAKLLYDLNYKNYDTIIGYKELIDYFKGNISLDEAKDKIKKDSRHYAKRQITWFKNQMNDIKWFDVNYDDINITLSEIKNYIK